MLKPRPWAPRESNAFVQGVAEDVAAAAANRLAERLERLVRRNAAIHRDECINLNPAGNVMNPRAEALLARGLGSRPSLGYPRAKHEAGLEAIEEIEAMAAAIAARIFGADFVEFRLSSGSMANLACYMALLSPGDVIFAPPAEIGGHASHHANGAAGLYRLKVLPTPFRGDQYALDLERMRTLSLRERPKLIILGGSLNLKPHPVRAVRAIADEVGALLLYDAAHVAGLIAGGVWQQPLAEGAHIVTMSTYKSLGGPPGALVLTNEPGLAERIERTVFPGLTANYDAARIAALAVALTDTMVHGSAYATAMIAAAKTLAKALNTEGIPVFGKSWEFTSSHQFALDARSLGGATETVARLRRANLLASAIPLPVDNGTAGEAGVRMGTPELVRIGVQTADMPQLARFVANAIYERAPLASVASEVSAFRRRFPHISFAGDSISPSVGIGT